MHNPTYKNRSINNKNEDYLIEECLNLSFYSPLHSLLLISEILNIDGYEKENKFDKTV